MLSTSFRKLLVFYCCTSWTNEAKILALKLYISIWRDYTVYAKIVCSLPLFYSEMLCFLNEYLSSASDVPSVAVKER